MVLTALLALSLAASDGGPAATDPRAAGPAVVSLQGGETLGAGHSELGLSAGFSTVSVLYAQALSDGVDAGALGELDWLTTEAFLGGWYRSLLWRSGATSVAWRARVGLYGDFGATWAVSGNRSDTGLQLAPGLAISQRLERGVVSVLADLPLTPTFQRGGGVLFGPRAAAAFETPISGDLLAGARFGAGTLVSGGGAPFGTNSPRLLVDVSALLTYRLF